MTKRIAFFPSREDFENYFGISINEDSLIKPNYNISAGQQITVLKNLDKNPELISTRWGVGTKNETEIHVTKVQEEFEKGNVVKCIIPMSGFYVWKDNKITGYPFFVRMISSPIMSVAGLLYVKEDNEVKIITSKANVLVQPMTETMPLLFDMDLSQSWLHKKVNSSEVLEKASKRFLLTDLSVTRVSKKVNDPKNNDSGLIQPIPK